MNLKTIRKSLVLSSLSLCFATASFGQSIQALFTPSATVACGVTPILFSDKSTGDIDEWIWDYGNGSNPMSYTKQENHAITYAPGEYVISLTVRKGTETNTYSQKITINETPTAQFSLSGFNGCTDTEFEFVNESTSPVAITNYTWSFGDGSGSNQQNPKHTYAIEGKYTIGLTVKDANGCSETKTFSDTIKVSKPLNISISASTTEACASPMTTTFSPTITNGTAVEYLWDFGDGNSSTEQNPAYTYNADGSYNVTFSATTNTGCVNSKTFNDFIKINTFDVDFEPASSLCDNTSIQFKATANSTMGTWQWDLGNGESATTQNATTTYTSASNYTISLQGTSSIGCVKSKTKTYKINARPTVAASADKTQGCASDGLTVAFTDNSSNVSSWSWDFGDGATSISPSPSHSYTTEGAYNAVLTATDANGCQNTSAPIVVSVKNPTALFEITSSDGENFCLGSTTTITDKSSSDFGGLTYQWSAFDESKITSQTKTGQNFEIIFSESGVYSVELTITDAAGCQSTYSDTIKIGRVPTKPVIVADDACYNKMGVDLKAISAESNTWDWEFGDGEDSTYYADGEVSFKHIYGDPGTYTMKLVAREYYCPSEPADEKTITINVPKSEFTYSPRALCFFPGEMTFDPSNSKGAESYLWDFGDETDKIFINKISDGHYEWKKGGETGDVIEADVETFMPKHEYAVANNYTVTLISYAGECSDTLPMRINMSGIKIGFTQDTTEICLGDAIEFSDTSKTATSTIISRRWIFDTDTVTATSAKKSYVFSKAGTFNVGLRVENGDGCADSTVKNNIIIVNPLPRILSFKAMESDADSVIGCKSLDLTFNSSETGPADIVSYLWNFGDGKTSTDKVPQHTYTKGTYNLSLKVTDEKGCSKDSTKTKYVMVSNPQPSFTIPDMVCAYTDVQPVNKSVGSNLQYLWEWGDETEQGIVANPTHSYMDRAVSDTSFTITLTVVDTLFKCKSDPAFSKVIKVRSPQANFIASDSIFTCPPADVNFSNLSTGTNLSYAWEFFDGSLPSTVTDAYWKYFKSGIYDVQLSVTDNFGCKDTLFKDDYITVYGPRGELSVSQIAGCTYDTIQFKGVNVVGATNRTWIFGDGQYWETGDVDSTEYTYKVGNYYIPTLLLSDDNNCEVTILGDKMTIYSANLSFEGDSILCEPTTAVLHNTSTSLPVEVDSWEWTFSSGDTLKTQDAALDFDYGLYDLSLTATIQGCQYRIDSTGFLNVLRTLDVMFSTTQNPAKTIETVVFTNETDTAFGLPVFTEWNFDDGKSSKEFNPSHTFMEDGLYNVSLTSYIHEECPNTYTLPLEVLKEYLIPNVFTPNGDGINDIFLENMDEVELIIINRWGQKVFEGIGGWDGMCNGKEMSAGTYFYMITMPNGDKFEGPLMLIRN